MPRSYKHIQDYAREIEQLKREGYTNREIGNKLGFSYKQMRNYFYRTNVAKRKLEAGIVLKRKGRPPKDYVITEESKNAELRYILARKDAQIKSLEMENELLRDFLLLTGRK